MTGDTVDQIDTLENITTAMFLVLTVVVAAVGIRSASGRAGYSSFMFAFMIVNLLSYAYFMVMFGMLLGPVCS